MKLTKDLIGKKLVTQNSKIGSYFIPLAQSSSGDWFGEDEEGVASMLLNPNADWELYEEPKKKVLRAPVAVKWFNGRWTIQDELFLSLEDAEAVYSCNHRNECFWPAPGFKLEEYPE